MSVDDFYKVYGYACFYKADATRVNEVRIEELTISLISEGYPRKTPKAFTGGQRAAGHKKGRGNLLYNGR